MAQHTFQDQLVSIMDILAKAAVAEINRRVDDSCAVIRLELSRSQRDIDTLKRKCQVMENELRKARVRGRRKVFFCKTSEKLPMPFPTVWTRETDADVCSAEQTGSPQEPDPGQSAHHIHQTIQILEDAPKVPVIKEEASENETWSSGEAAGQFTFEHQDNLPQETPEENLHEGLERPNTHFTCMLSSTELAKSNEEGQSQLRLQIKAEKEQEDEKEEQKVVVEVASERMRDTGDHLEFALEQRDSQIWHQHETEWTDKNFTSAQLSRDLAGFSQPGDTTMEHCGKDSRPKKNAQAEMYNAAQVNSQKQLQASWCRERHQSNPAVKHLNTQLNTQQRNRTPARTAEVNLGANMASQTGSNAGAQALSGYGRGGLSTVRRLRTHWRTNAAGERRFSCNFCERRFVRFGQLKEHLRSHTGERPYTCAQCGRSFTKQGNLIRHAVVHSGEKPYQCGLCGKCFTQRSSLKSHQKTHMPERGDALQGLPVYQSGNSLSRTQRRGLE